MVPIICLKNLNKNSFFLFTHSFVITYDNLKIIRARDIRILFLLTVLSACVLNITVTNNQYA